MTSIYLIIFAICSMEVGHITGKTSAVDGAVKRGEGLADRRNPARRIRDHRGVADEFKPCPFCGGRYEKQHIERTDR